MKIKFTGALLSAATLILAAPAAVLADPPAVGAPTIPGAFINSPTTQGPQGGEFTANFTDQGQLTGFGRADQHYQQFDLTTVQGRRQASNSAKARRHSQHEKGSVNAVFTGFENRLRTIDYSNQNK